MNIKRQNQLKTSINYDILRILPIFKISSRTKYKDSVGNTYLNLVLK